MLRVLLASAAKWISFLDPASLKDPQVTVFEPISENKKPAQTDFNDSGKQSDCMSHFLKPSSDKHDSRFGTNRDQSFYTQRSLTVLQTEWNHCNIMHNTTYIQQLQWLPRVNPCFFSEKQSYIQTSRWMKSGFSSGYITRDQGQAYASLHLGTWLQSYQLQLFG